MKLRRKILAVLAAPGVVAALGLDLASTARADYGPTPDEQTLTPAELGNVERDYVRLLHVRTISIGPERMTT